MIVLESVWPLRVTQLWWVPMEIMTMATDSGSAYVFTRTGTTWTEQAKLTASDDGVLVIILERVWPLQVTQLWWVPGEIMTMAMTVEVPTYTI